MSNSSQTTDSVRGSVPPLPTPAGVTPPPPPK